MLAVRSGAPVLPVYVSKLPGPLARLRGEKHHVYVGEVVQIDPGLRGGAAYREAADEVMRSIYALPRQQPRRAGAR